MKKKIMDLVTKPTVKFNFLPEETLTGKQRFNAGLCDTHRHCVSTSNKMEDYMSSLSNVILLVEYVRRGMISVASAIQKQQGSVYVEIRQSDNTFEWFYADCNVGSVRLYASTDSTFGKTITMAILAILAESKVKKYYDDLMASSNTLSLLDKSFPFCDSFEYDFALEVNNTYEEMNSFATEELKQAYRTGLMTDISEMFTTATDDKVVRCTLFRDIVSRSPAEKPAKETRQDKMSEFLSTSHHVDHEWDESQKDRIRPFSFLENFVPTDTFFKIMKKMDLRIRKNMVENLQFGITDPWMIRSEFVNMLFYGDPGTGKTVLANAIAAATGMPIYEITFNEDSEEDEFEGKNKIVEGKLSFVETAFLEGFSKGGILLLEEINLARANIFTSVLNQAMEYPYIIKRNGYERIQRHPLTVIIGTMNLETEGTTSLNSACAQRFTSKYLVEEMSDEEMISALKKRGFKAGDVRYVYVQYKKLRKSLKESDQERKLLREISIRQCIDALSAIEEGVEPREAVIDSLYGALAVKNKRIADKYNGGMFQAMPNYRK